MVSLLADAQKNGHKTIANVTSIAASMASVIACACQELNLYEGAFLMCHRPWGVVVGNSKDLQKEISTLDQIKNSMVKIYKTKFDLTDEEIDQMLEAETWIDADNYKDYKLSCSIVSGGEPLKLAASISDKHYSFVKDFKNTPQRIRDMENIDVSAKAEEEKKDVSETETPVEEEPSKEEKKEEQAKAEEKIEEEKETPDEEEEKPTYEELESRIAELEKENDDLKKQLAECGGDEEKKDLVTREECEKRVHGMQSSMQKQINDFENQLKERTQELTKANAEITRLSGELENTSEELSKVASALEEKNMALEKLNSNVNAKSDEDIPTMAEGLAKCASPAEKVAFLKSGRYVR